MWSRCIYIGTVMADMARINEEQMYTVQIVLVHRGLMNE